MKRVLFTITVALALHVTSLAAQSSELFLVYRDSIRLYMSKHDLNASLRCADKLIGFYPSNVNGYLLKAEVLDQAKRYNDELVVLRILRNLQPTLPETYIRLAVAHYKLVQIDSSIVDLTQAITGNRYFDSTAFRLRGFAYHDTHRYQESMRDLDSAARYKPNDREFYLIRARVKRH